MKLRKHDHTYVYDVYRENGTKVCQCGSLKDAEMMVSLSPSENRKITPVAVPPPPIVVNVSYTEGEREKQLESQNILPETQQQPFTT